MSLESSPWGGAEPSGNAVDGDVTRLLSAARNGDEHAVGQLCELLYHDLRRLARSRLRAHQPLTLIETTALVHESFLRLLKIGRIEIADRAHFLAYASRAMHSTIVDFIRAKHAERRGGDLEKVVLDTAVLDQTVACEDEVIRLSEAIERLAAVDPRAMQVVEMRYFAGMSEREIAAALDVTERTVRRDWQKAKLLLQAALTLE